MYVKRFYFSKSLSRKCNHTLTWLHSVLGLSLKIKDIFITLNLQVVLIVTLEVVEIYIICSKGANFQGSKFKVQGSSLISIQIHKYTFHEGIKYRLYPI